MDDRMGELVNELDQITETAQAALRGLTREQLNWTPMADSWSIAQCLDHLITINGLYFPLLAALRTGPTKPTLWERYSPFSRVLGRLLIKTLSPEYPGQTKTSSKAEPSRSEIDVGIVDRFARHQTELIGHLRLIPHSVDRQRTIVTSPLLRWVTYNLDDCLTILVVHEKRHWQQAKRVMAAEAFPKTASYGGEA
jgi:uncharacterized damage-inducible protein DinB